MDKKYLWKFCWDTRREGSVEGLFVATEQEMSGLIGKDVYFGEILGKHSEVCGTMEWEDVEKINLNDETIEKVSSVLGNTWSGYNPFEYLPDDE